MTEAELLHLAELVAEAEGRPVAEVLAALRRWLVLPAEEPERPERLH